MYQNNNIIIIKNSKNDNNNNSNSTNKTLHQHHSHQNKDDWWEIFNENCYLSQKEIAFQPVLPPGQEKLYSELLS